MRYYEIVEAASESGLQDWFQGSQIVDASGRPMRLYHGTLNDIQAFRPGDGRNGTVLGSGVMYFTADPRDAGGYGRETVAQAREAGRKLPKDYQSGANIVPVYLRITNPLLYTHPMPLGDDLVKLAKDRGHDGIIFSTGKDDVNKYREVVIFSPDQVKFALSTR